MCVACFPVHSQLTLRTLTCGRVRLRRRSSRVQALPLPPPSRTAQSCGKNWGVTPAHRTRCHPPPGVGGRVTKSAGGLSQNGHRFRTGNPDIRGQFRAQRWCGISLVLCKGELGITPTPLCRHICDADPHKELEVPPAHPSPTRPVGQVGRAQDGRRSRGRQAGRVSQYVSRW